MKIRTIESLQEVYTGREVECYHYGENFVFHVGRVNNDVNGNPLYKLSVWYDYEPVTQHLKGHVYRCYASKGYALVQTYDLHRTLNSLLNEVIGQAVKGETL